MEDSATLLRRPLDNATCPYCAAELTDKAARKEHVIGRRFVPKGSLNQSSNVILNACDDCNNRKSDLEDDISAITMLKLDDGLASDTRRKSTKSISRRTRKPVEDSAHEITLTSHPAPGVTISERWSAPPQLDESRVYELACYHVLGVFYAITYEPDLKRGTSWPGGFFPIMFSSAWIGEILFNVGSCNWCQTGNLVSSDTSLINTTTSPSVGILQMMCGPGHWNGITKFELSVSAATKRSWTNWLRRCQMSQLT